ncbi:MAG: BsuPI-related putative proteinase inhibitor [Bacillota bacterium]
MRRFLLPVLILTLALLLSACGANRAPQKEQPDQWGNLRVTLEKVQQTETQWSANLAVHNPTEKMQAMQYRGASRYTMVVTREGKEVLRRGFESMDPNKPEILNLTAGITKNHVVVWTFRDEAGNRVEPGTYEISVTLNGVTVVPVANPQAGQPAEQLVGPKTVGPVQVTVK